jgi:hypothetical protein
MNSYSLRTVEQFLTMYHFNYIYCSPPCNTLIQTGVRIFFDEANNISLSVQTHIDVVAHNFASTLLERRTRGCAASMDIVHDEEQGYKGRALYFERPDTLFKHLLNMKHKYQK